MKKLLLIIFLFAANSVLAAPLSLDIHTPDRPKSMQFAKVYFLPDWKDKGMAFDSDGDCSAYPLSYCKGYKVPDPASYCPGNSVFFSRCICPDSFIKCELPAFGSGAQCDDKYSVCTEDTERACKLENPDYTNSCPAGTKPDMTKRCSYDSDYGACCNTCAAYPESEIKDGYELVVTECLIIRSSPKTADRDSFPVTTVPKSAPKSANPANKPFTQAASRMLRFVRHRILSKKLIGVTAHSVVGICRRRIPATGVITPGAV